MMASKKIKSKRLARTLDVVALDLGITRLCLVAAVEEGNWDRADNLQRKLEGLQEEASALAHVNEINRG